MSKFLKKAFSEMAESARNQHDVDKANFAAAKAEAKAQWEEAKAMGRPETRKKMIQAQRAEQLTAAQQRIKAAEERKAKAKK